MSHAMQGNPRCMGHRGWQKMRWLDSITKAMDMNLSKLQEKSFPRRQVSKESTCNTGDPGLFPGSGRSSGEGIGYPLQYSDLENAMDCIVHGVAKSWAQLHFQEIVKNRGAWHAVVHGVTKSQRWLNNNNKGHIASKKHDQDQSHSLLTLNSEL